MGEKAYSKACSLLSSETTLAPINDDTIYELRRLHQPATTSPWDCTQLNTSSAPPDAPFVDCLPESHFYDNILKTLKSFPPLSAPGPSGLRAQHLVEALHVRTMEERNRFYLALENWIRASSSSKLPKWSAEWLGAAKLVPLCQRQSTKIRPIAVGEVLRRLTGKLLLNYLTPSVRSYLTPIQLGVGVSTATELITHCVKETLDSNPEKFLLQVDLSNAFNSLHRRTMLKAVDRAAPALSAFCHYLYDTPTPLLCGTAVLSSCEGTQQGDPLGPALFCLAIHPVLKELQNAAAIDWQGWYMDDGSIIGSHELISFAVTFLKERFSALGLILNTKKSVFLSPCAPSAVTHCGPIMRTSWNQGASVLGIPIGSADTVSRTLTTAFDNLQRLLNRLPLLEFNQGSFLLLKWCLGCQKLTHLWRLIWSEETLALAERTEAALRHSLECMVGLGLTDRAWAEANLPVSLGGLGISNPLLLRSSAYVASTLSYLSNRDLVTSGETPTVLGSTFWGAIQFIHSYVSPAILMKQHLPLGSWIENKSVPSIHDICAGKLFLQSTWSAAIHDQLSSIVMTSATHRDRIRLSCQKTPHSGTWLSATPNEAMGMTLSNCDLRLLLRFRLGLPVYPSLVVGTPCPFCQRALDPHGDHMVSCQTSGFWTRHNAVRDTIQHIAEAAGLIVKTEVPVEGKARPADLLMTPWKGGKSIAVDLTLVHPLNASSLWSADNDAVSRAEQVKVLKYSDLCDRAHLLFSPAGLDTFGGPGPMALDFLKTLFNTYAQHQSTDESQQARSVLIAGCWERLTMAVAKAVAFQLSRLAYPMPSASHGYVSPRVGSPQGRLESSTTADVNQESMVPLRASPSHTQAATALAANDPAVAERGVPPQDRNDSTSASSSQGPTTPPTRASQSLAQATATPVGPSKRPAASTIITRQGPGQSAATTVQAYAAATPVRPSERPSQAAVTSLHNRARGRTK